MIHYYEATIDTGRKSAKARSDAMGTGLGVFPDVFRAAFQSVVLGLRIESERTEHRFAISHLVVGRFRHGTVVAMACRTHRKAVCQK